MKKFYIITIIFLSLSMIIVYTYFNRKQDINKLIPRNTLRHSVHVLAERAVIKSLSQFITNTATLSALQKGKITAEVSSYIREVKVHDGESVSQGDTLILLDQSLFQIELEKARGDFFKAATEFISELKLTGSKKALEWENFLGKLFQLNTFPALPNSLSKSKMMSIVRYNLHNHYTEVKKKEKQKNYCIITAPFNGLISDIQVYPGVHVGPASVLLTLTNISQMKVEIDILESDLSHISIGSSFKFYNSPSMNYTISAVHPAINPDTRLGKVMAVIDNVNNQYKDGQKEMVRLVKQVFENRLVVPRNAILTRNDRDLVFVVKNGIAKWQYIETGVGNADFIEITQGVLAGDTVVASGHYSLAHNVPVTVKTINAK